MSKKTSDAVAVDQKTAVVAGQVAVDQKIEEIEGFLGSDPESIPRSGKDPMVKLLVAVGGNRREGVKPVWWTVLTFNGTAAAAAAILKKGDGVLVRGPLGSGMNTLMGFRLYGRVWTKQS